LYLGDNADIKVLIKAALQPFCYRGTPDILLCWSWNPLNKNWKKRITRNDSVVLVFF